MKLRYAPGRNPSKPGSPRHVVAAVVLAACGGAPAPRAAGEPAAPDAGALTAFAGTLGAPSTSLPVPVTPAHWVPRITGSFSFRGAFGAAPAFHGPIQNNEGTTATAYLGKGSVGLLSNGQRELYVASRPTSVTRIRGDGPGKLTALTVASRALGGGVVFAGDDGLYAAAAFDAPLNKIGESGASFGGFGPGVALVIGHAIVSVPDGKLVTSAPEHASTLVGHATGGFAVAIDEFATFFTRDGKQWKRLPIKVSRAGEDGPDILAELADRQENARFVRIDPRGRIHPVTIDPRDRDQQTKLSMRVLFGAEGQTSGAYEDGFEGALLDLGFVHTGRAPDEWIGARGANLNVAAAGLKPQTLGAPLPPDTMCNPFPLDGVLQLVCANPGEKLVVNSLDLDSGALAPIHTIATSGVTRFLGVPPGFFPETLVVTASCAGDPSGGYCVRGPGNRWTSAPVAPPNARMLAFPGEVLFLVPAEDGALSILDVKSTLRSFGPEEMARIHATVGDEKVVALESNPSVVTGMLRTAGGLRVVYGPNPFRKPTTADRSYVVDLPLSGHAEPTLAAFEGTVAFAGWHALRKTESGIFESDDGCVTWHAISLPPDGAVPSFDGAMCRRDGCMLAAWDRIGWDG